MHKDIYVEAGGRWPSILVALGVGEKFLRNKHGPCPKCGGRDRFRFDDREGMGTWFCSKCGAGNGIDLLKLINEIEFKEAVKMVRGVLPQSNISRASKKNDAATDDYVRKIWNESKPATKADDTGRYLKGRGLILPTECDTLRTHRALEYRDDAGKVVDKFPCMLAAIRNGKGGPTGVHRTWILDGKKAPVPKPKKTLGRFDSGGAVRLFNENGGLGIAEGIETAIAAYMLFNLPVWALVSASQMERWSWPEGLKRLLIAADNDASFTGHKAAYCLAFRAKSRGIDVEVMIPNAPGEDWNDYV